VAGVLVVTGVSSMRAIRMRAIRMRAGVDMCAMIHR
jgi:hypothetical protein